MGGPIPMVKLRPATIRGCRREPLGGACAEESSSTVKRESCASNARDSREALVPGASIQRAT